MVSKNIHFIALFFIGWLILTNIACNKETPVEPNIPSLPLPPLTDTIPYDVLGQGKVVFERIGPFSGRYKGLYVIDIDEQSSWGIDIGLEVSPVVSPDGKKIATSKYSYSSEWSSSTWYDIHVMNIDGTNQQNISYIVGQDRTPSWTHDSKQILFHVEAHPDSPKVPLYKQSPVANPPDRILIKNFDGLGRVEGPFSVSPNGKLVFIKGSDICTMGMDGNNLEVLVPHPDDSSLESPACSPDGQKVAFLSVVRDSTYRSIEIMLIDIDGGNPNSLTILEAYGGSEWSVLGLYRNVVYICWSPDGSKLLFNKPDGDFVSHLYVINADGSGLIQITSAEGVTDRCVSWSN